MLGTEVLVFEVLGSESVKVKQPALFSSIDYKLEMTLK